MTWVLSRTHIRVHRYPSWGEKIEVLTWPSGRHGFFALRDFETTDGHGIAVFSATTSWMVIDLDRKQPLRIDDVLPAGFLLDKRALPDEFASLPVLDGAEREVSFRVEMNHLDLNRHVNNAVYVQWALEAAPEETLRRRRPVDVEVSYRAEAVYGDSVLSRSAAEAPLRPGPDIAEVAAPAFLHQIVNAVSGTELTRLRTRWT